MGNKQTKRPARREKKAVKTLRQQLQRQGLFKDDLMRLEETDAPKVATALLSLMAPYTGAAVTRGTYEQLATVAVVAWNAALLEAEERQALLAAALTAIVAAAGEQWRKDTAELLATLVERKLSQFPDDRRFVVDYRVTEAAEAYHLTVATLARRQEGVDLDTE